MLASDAPPRSSRRYGKTRKRPTRTPQANTSTAAESTNDALASFREVTVLLGAGRADNHVAAADSAGKDTPFAAFRREHGVELRVDVLGKRVHDPRAFALLDQRLERRGFFKWRESPLI